MEKRLMEIGLLEGILPIQHCSQKKKESIVSLMDYLKLLKRHQKVLGIKRAGRVILRELTNLNNLAGRITAFKIAASIPINTLVDKALKRANSKNAPTDNKYRAWASSAFDYRKTRKEVYGKDTKSPNNKVISKSWKEIMRA